MILLLPSFSSDDFLNWLMFSHDFEGPINHFKPDSGRADIKKWQKKVKETNR